MQVSIALGTLDDILYFFDCVAGMQIVKLMNGGVPCCAWRMDEDSHVLEGVHGIGARANFEELLAP